MRFLRQLPLTRLKIWCARCLYKLVRLIYRRDHYQITRDGINYEVDLSEGIELSMFLFGNFQSHVLHNPLLELPTDGVVFDVGANVGMMALQYAKQVPDGKVYAFEPTHYAYQKLHTNLGLNPELASRITTIQTLLGDTISDTPDMTVYSSWKVDGSNEGDTHAVHRGTAKSTDGVPVSTLDHFVSTQGIERLDLMKIDTDGYEYVILQGAKEAIAKLKPTIVFEIGLYVLEEHGITYQDVHEFFAGLNYVLHEPKNGRVVTLENVTQYVPQNATTDLIAKPQ